MFKIIYGALFVVAFAGMLLFAFALGQGTGYLLAWMVG